MSDNKKLTGTPDSTRIDIHDPNEVRNWSKSLDCTKPELERAVQEVGTSADAVRRHLKK